MLINVQSKSREIFKLRNSNHHPITRLELKAGLLAFHLYESLLMRFGYFIINS